MVMADNFQNMIAQIQEVRRKSHKTSEESKKELKDLRAMSSQLKELIFDKDAQIEILKRKMLNDDGSLNGSFMNGNSGGLKA